MNLPNKLTMLRVILIPFFVFALLNPGGIVPYSDYVALVIFIIASLTDMADGKIARKYGLVADNGIVIAASYWGKFKTTFQMIMIILMILNIERLQLLTDIIMWIALALTIISLCDYIMKNKQVISQTK